MDSPVRLNKFLAHNAGISRREADDYITHGRITINGVTAIIGDRVQPGDHVTLDGKPLEALAEKTYLLLNKPAGYVCSRKQQGDNPTIYSLLPEKYHELKPVGRLDADSSGLILLTNDGDFAHQMTHPKFQKTKVYEVTLDKPLQPLHRQMISDFGVMLEDGKSQFLVERPNEPLGTSFPETSAARVSTGAGAQSDTRSEAVSENDGGEKAAEDLDWRITMHEGRNRQIRRTFAALGYTVTKLHRTQFGKYSLGDIKSGETVEL
jgi:23S rRNA pseudouridine2605 synthase